MTVSELRDKFNSIIYEHGSNALVLILDAESKRLRDVTDLEFNFVDVPEWKVTKPVVYIK